MYNLIETLEWCEAMWRWLANNPNREKPDWFKLTHPNSGFIKFDCYCCQYVMDHHIEPGLDGLTGEMDCVNLCPLAPLWPEGCIRNDTPYKLWENDAKADRPKHAKEIADYCRQELGRLRELIAESRKEPLCKSE